jgi:hypothetical protein
MGHGAKAPLAVISDLITELEFTLASLAMHIQVYSTVVIQESLTALAKTYGSLH